MRANSQNAVDGIKKQLDSVPAVVQLPIATQPTPPEADFEGVIDLVKMNAVIWSGEEMGAAFQEIPVDDAPISDELKAAAKQARDELIELAVEQDEDALMAYLEGEVRSAAATSRARARAHDGALPSSSSAAHSRPVPVPSCAVPHAGA